MPGKISVRVGPVNQTLHVLDWGVTLAVPIVGLAATSYPLRLFSPGRELLTCRLWELVTQARDGCPRARQGLGLLFLGAILQPRRVTNDRHLRLRDLELLGLGKTPHAVKSNFARALRSKTPGPGEDPDIDQEVVSTLLHSDVVADPAIVAAARAQERELTEALISRNDLLFFQSSVADRHPAEANRLRNVVRVFVERRVPDRRVRQVLALRSLGAMDAFVSDVNAEILERLPDDTTPAERRAFRVMFLKQSEPFRPTSVRHFTGVVASNRLVMSLLGWAPEAVQAHLILTFLHRAWAHDHGHPQELVARRNLCGLLRLGRLFIELLRDKDREAKAATRPAPRRDERSRFVLPDQDQLTDLRDLLKQEGSEVMAARALIAKRSTTKHRGRPLTAKQAEALELYQSMSVSDIARLLGITRQSVAERIAAARANLSGRRRR